MMFDTRAIFFGRGGTLVKSVLRPDFIEKVTAPFNRDELEFTPRVKEVLEFSKEAGFMRIMVTNQPDVSLGYMTQLAWNVIHSEVILTLNLDDFYMCRHTTTDKCPCKKPSPLMLKVAACKWGIDLNRSYMVGATRQDMETGKAAGCQTVLIRTIYNKDARDIADHKIARLAGLINIIKYLDTA